MSLYRVVRGTAGWELWLNDDARPTPLAEGLVIVNAERRAEFVPAGSLPVERLHLRHGLEVDVQLTVGRKLLRRGWHPAPDATHRCSTCGRWLDLAVDATALIDWSKVHKLFGQARYHPHAARPEAPCGPLEALPAPLLQLGLLTGAVGSVVSVLDRLT